MTTARTARLNAIEVALGQAADRYQQAREAYDKAKVGYEIAKHSLAGVREMASDIMTADELEAWRKKNQFIKYAGVPIGQAIAEALFDYLVAAANTAEGKIARFKPEMTLEEIVRYLEIGGFDFQSSSPAREVNAGVMALTRAADPTIRKRDDGKYESINSDSIREAWAPTT